MKLVYQFIPHIPTLFRYFFFCWFLGSKIKKTQNWISQSKYCKKLKKMYYFFNMSACCKVFPCTTESMLSLVWAVFAWITASVQHGSNHAEVLRRTRSQPSLCLLCCAWCLSLFPLQYVINSPHGSTAVDLKGRCSASIDVSDLTQLFELVLLPRQHVKVLQRFY